MKNFIITILLAFSLTACATNSVTNKVSIENYRKQYSSLVVKYQKEDDSAKRKIIRQQMEELKQKNLHLFKK